jgi:hypothetical protein
VKPKDADPSGKTFFNIPPSLLRRRGQGDEELNLNANHVKPLAIVACFPSFSYNSCKNIGERR